MIAQAAGRSITLVASPRPPSPTSSTQRSAGISANSRKRDGGDHLEHGDRRAGVHPLHLGERVEQRRVGDELAGEPDALVEAHQMRRGVDVHAPAGRLADRAQEGAGAALAVGAGDMDHRRQAPLGMAELGEQRAAAGRG